jgi:hypothetical protein
MSRFLLEILFISMALVIAGINKGFDFSDDGLYMFLVDPHQAKVGEIIGSYLIDSDWIIVKCLF